MDAAATARDEAIATLESSLSDLFRTVRTWHRQLAQTFDPPLPMFGFGVLRFLREHGPVRIGDLVHAFDTDKAMVSRQVAALRERGFIVHRDDPTDRRASLIEISPQAEAELTRARLALRASYRHVVDEWSDDELLAFTAMLDRFRHALRS